MLGIILAALLFVMQFSCGNAKKTGGTSPAETFAKAKSAALIRDWQKLFQYFDPQDRAILVFNIGMNARYSSAFGTGKDNNSLLKELGDIQRKHEARWERSIGEGFMLLNQPDRIDKAANEYVENVKDLSKLFCDLVAFLDRDSQAAVPIELPIRENLIDSELRDLKITDETATATFVKSDSANYYPYKFVKRDGIWYISIRQ